MDENALLNWTLTPGTTIGVDPGLTGAIAVLRKNNSSIQFIRVFDMPVVDGKVDARGVYGVLHWILAQHGAISGSPGSRVLLLKEQQIAMPAINSKTGIRDRQPSPASMGNFFHGGGVIEGVATALGIDYREISAAAWKVSTGCPADKTGARALAAKLFPEAATELKRVKDHGRADAIMLAAYGYGYRG